MKIISIDPGYERLGLAVVEKKAGQIKLLFSTCLLTTKNDEFAVRLKYLGERIDQEIKKWQPNGLALEKVFFAKNQKTAGQISEVRGMIIYLTAKANIHLYEYTPMEIKNTVGGYGGADKNQIITMVEKLLSLTEKKKYDDEYDAIATGLTCLARIKATYPQEKT
ncbi:MAG: crossover junction endodeoxyribonuclease RuvC [Candidatus Paceibacterota bacterium]